MDGKFSDEYYDYTLKGVEPSTEAKKAVFSIIEDLSDRRGLRQEFENIDSDVQDEIIETWIDLVSNAFNKTKI